MDLLIKKEKNIEIIAQLQNEIQNLHNKCYPDLFKPYDYNLIYDLYKNIINCETIHCFIAYDLSTPVGFAIIAEQIIKDHPLFYDHKEIFIDTIVVLNEYQSKGIGKKLMEEIKTLSCELKYNKITLNVWNKNYNAIEFYKKMGFKELFNNFELYI
ncbi:MAG: hypothetical protein A2086_06355 [Spirochaetes bacterium GWD1_27_9]|nr:MAG: hypothetical protein A2Z98_17020 [Spirochaetes bacterium GWB1_27_13]OHD25957.1 MAG: hypothetical protein A2Y34_14460 [Spirochaetes bacterium GWC1_27_15]OHD43510.1 MAG: hypothetical protein A2086_06355 [Spirochaetes bacterium GWD1_27_9]